MSAPSTFAGLRRLMQKAGLSTADAPTESGEGKPKNEDDGEDEGDGSGAPVDPPVEEVEGEGEGESEGEGEGSGEGEGEGEGDGGAAAANTASADYRAGVAATEARWAAVLVSPAAQGNLELATDLLADSQMSSARIIQMCEQHKAPVNAGKDLLARTPRPAIGADEGGAAPDAAQTARKTAAARVNASKTGGKGIKAMRAAAAAAAK